MISFHGETVAQLHREFKKAIDDYLADCDERGVGPERPASGKILLRVPAEVHGAALLAAQVAGKSLNQWATDVLRRAARADQSPPPQPPHPLPPPLQLLPDDESPLLPDDG